MACYHKDQVHILLNPFITGKLSLSYTKIGILQEARIGCVAIRMFFNADQLQIFLKPIKMRG